MKLGARTFKTGLAVVLSLVLAKLFQLPSPVFAGTSAALAVQPSVYRSYLTLVEQIQGNLIGAILAFSSYLLFGDNVLVIGLTAIILIMLHIQFKIDKVIPLSLSTLIVLMETPEQNFMPFAGLRFLTIMLGVLSAFIVNMAFFPPKYEKRLFTTIYDLSNDLIRWIRLCTQNAADYHLLKMTIDSFKDRFIRLDQIYLFYKEERKLLKKQNQTKLRKLVIYRQMINTANKAFEILKRQHHYENRLSELQQDVTSELFEKVDQLTINHEHLLLRYMGQAVQDHDKEMQEYKINRNELLLLYNKYQDLEKESENLPHLLQFIASIMDYNEQLEHLEILISSKEAFHKDEEVPTIEQEIL